LLCIPEYQAVTYCASIEAAKLALFTVYPQGFVGLPSTAFTLTDRALELDSKKALTESMLPAVERFNAAVEKIAEITSSSTYRSKVARESAKLKARAGSVTTLISGLLHYHKSLTVVAVRLSIRQTHVQDFIGAKMHKALKRLIGDRRNDALLNSAVGYFWVLQESFKGSFRQRLSMVPNENSAGAVALHYDLVMFFNGARFAETNAIAKHIGERWRFITGEAGFYRSLNGENLTPYFSNRVNWWMERNGYFPSDAEFVGLVREGSVQEKNLKNVAQVMVFSAILRKPSKQAPTFIKSTMRRFGKSDLLTGRDFDRGGKGTNDGYSDVRHERKKRPKYVPQFTAKLMER
jgi:hypothetical protein